MGLNGNNDSTQKAWQKPWIKRCAKLLSWGMFGCLILLTVYVSVGRMMMPVISAQKEAVELQLSAALGVPVQMTSLSASWFRFGPRLQVNGFRIEIPDASATSPSSTILHEIQQLNIVLNMPASLLNGRLVIKEIRVADIELELEQSVTGRWTLAGIVSGDIDYSEQIVNFLLQIQHLNLSEARLTLRPNSGEVVNLSSVYLALENNTDRHELQLQFRINNQASPSLLSLSMEGDSLAEFSAQAHLETLGVDLAAMFPQLLPDSYSLTAARASAEIWWQFNEQGLQLVSGTLKDLNLEASVVSEDVATGLSLQPPLQQQGIDLNNASIDFTVNQNVASELPVWQVWLENIELDWMNRPWSVGDVYFQVDTDEQKKIRLLVEELDLTMVTDIALNAAPFPQEGLQAIEDLSPAGELNNIVFETSFDGNYPGGFHLAANLNDVAVGAWSGAPSGSGIQAYVQASQTGGFVELDSNDFNIHLEQIFTNSWHYDNINARVHWQLEGGEVRVNSSIIDVSNEDLHGRVQFDLFDRSTEDGIRESELTLMIGMLEMDASVKSLYLPTLENVQETMDWLDEAVLSGTISQSAFVSRTSLQRTSMPNLNTVLTWYNLENGNLQFLPEWPVLENISAFVKVNNSDADVFAQSAAIAGIALDPTVATLRPAEEGGSWLNIIGTAGTDTATGLDFLLNTPVQESMGSYAENWMASGELEIDISLGIGLGAQTLISENEIEVSVLSDNSMLILPDYGLTFEEIRGRVNYSSASGLEANALSASLFDFPVAAGIETFSSSSAQRSGTRIYSSGRASRVALQEWSEQPEFVRRVLDFSEGEIDYQAGIIIFNDPQEGEALSELIIKSDMLGLAIDLPAPFYKEIDDAQELELELSFFEVEVEQEALLSIRYGGFMTGQLALVGSDVDFGEIYFGDSTRVVDISQRAEAQSGLSISGELPYFNFDQWQELGEAFEAAIEEGGSPENAETSLSDYLSLAYMHFDRFEVFGEELLDIAAEVKRENNSWLALMQNEMLNGNFLFPDDETLPYEIELSYLRFPVIEDELENEEEGEAEAEEVDLLAEVNPGDLPDINFRTDEMSLGDKNLGSFEFQLRNNGNGVTISKFLMDSEDASITDITGESGANIDWRYNDEMHTTSFNGLFRAGDLAEVLPAWGYNANIESASAEFVGSLQWTGSPVAFSMAAATGQVEIEINDGSFVDIETGGARLFGALNFDSIVRRLQLDFSDVFGRGLAYDEIVGKLEFNKGIVTTDGELLIQGPSSRIAIDGEIDLINETIDADMLVNVPLVQNLSMLAGILASWPIAVSTYVASKIFKDQVDEITTIYYRLEGPWQDLQAGFEPSDELTAEAEAHE